MLSDQSNTASAATREKWLVALGSLLVTCMLLVLKLGVGILTNSLGILSQAADNGLDFMAALMTLWAVDASAKPADREHTYGHGKFESIAALFQTLLLLVTCGWIVYEAVRRIDTGRAADIDPNVWAFGVIIVSIAVDIVRSLVLRHAARKHNSQALEASALNFATDIWSSLVVLIGLAAVAVAKHWNLPWLSGADALAGIIVAGFVGLATLRLGKRSLGDLLDAVPSHLPGEVTQAAEEVRGVEAVRQVRVRRAGPETFADVTLAVDRQAGLETAHEVADRAEAAIHEVVPGIDVVVHIEPVASENEDLSQLIRLLATRRGMGAHAIRIYQHEGRRSVELHLEVDQQLDITAAHDLATAFEQDVREAVADLDRVVTHLEPAGDETATRQVESGDQRDVIRLLGDYPHNQPFRIRPHDVRVYRHGDELDVSLHCAVEPGTSIGDAHECTRLMEDFLRAQLPALGRVVIHAEPEHDAD